MKRLLQSLFVLGLTGAGIGLWLTAPQTLSEADLSEIKSGDVNAGERLFWAGGCASCHAAPKATGDAKKVLAGGHAFKTDFGTFYAPNISPHPSNGLGNWTLAAFANAMKKGVSPEGQHYYPAFPYTSYTRMKNEDVGHLWTYMKTLPLSKEPSRPHDVGFPFNIRRGLGLWKQLYLSDSPLNVAPELEKGAYLVEVLAHCGECHTPRNRIGGMNRNRHMAGGPNPDGKGSIPNITPHADGIGDWSASDIAESLKSGFTPEFDSFGGSMTAVQESMARLSDEDRMAIATYIKSLPALAKAP